MSVGSVGASNQGLTAPAPPRPKSAKAAAGSALASQTRQSTAASLEGQIRAAREQLNDWVTCVSATTPKGQAEIRSLSAQISAAQEHINHLQPSASSGTASSSSSAGAGVDVWA